MSRELDAACARAMGTPQDMLFVDDTPQGSAWRHWSPTFPSYSTDPTAARLLEDEIERRGLIKQYVAAVWSAIGQAGHNGEGPNIWKEEWALIRATPEQKAAAFLEAIK